MSEGARGSGLQPFTEGSCLSPNMCSASDFFVTWPKHMALNGIAVCTCGLKGHLRGLSVHKLRFRYAADLIHVSLCLKSLPLPAVKTEGADP